MKTITTFRGIPSVVASHTPDEIPWLGINRVPICVCCGVGVDSIALLVGMHQRGIRPDLITFADTGSEKPDTYLYIPWLRQWLREVDFPDLVVIRKTPPVAPYDSLHGNCLENHTLPSIAFGFQRKSCSLKWKKAPQDAW